MTIPGMLETGSKTKARKRRFPAEAGDVLFIALIFSACVWGVVEVPGLIKEIEFSMVAKKAHAGDPVEQHRLAMLYEIGFGTTPDPDMALYWRERAAVNGFQAAKERGRRYEGNLAVGALGAMGGVKMEGD